VCVHRRPEAAIAVSQQHAKARLDGDHEIQSAIAVHIAGSNPRGRGAGGKRVWRAKAPIAMAQEDLYAFLRGRHDLLPPEIVATVAAKDTNVDVANRDQRCVSAILNQ
jgi:hypothetical protein